MSSYLIKKKKNLLVEKNVKTVINRIDFIKDIKLGFFSSVKEGRFKNKIKITMTLIKAKAQEIGEYAPIIVVL